MLEIPATTRKALMRPESLVSGGNLRFHIRCWSLSKFPSKTKSPIELITATSGTITWANSSFHLLVSWNNSLVEYTPPVPVQRNNALNMCACGNYLVSWVGILDVFQTVFSIHLSKHIRTMELLSTNGLLKIPHGIEVACSYVRSCLHYI